MISSILPTSTQQAPAFKPLSPEEKVSSVAKVSIWKVATTSRVLRAVVLTAGTALLLLFLASNPLGLIFSSLVASFAIFITSLAIVSLIYLIAMSTITGKKMNFELSAIMRMCGFKGENAHEIVTGTRNTKLGKIYLGAIPNQLQDDGEKLFKEKKIEAVLSINEDWEAEQIGFSIPCNDLYWEKRGLENFKRINFQDHTLLGVEEMDAAAEFIRRQTHAGKNVYVHCRAGQSRSATAVAAYLMKYGRNGDKSPRMNIDETIHVIKDSRNICKIEKKRPALVAYEQFLNGEKHPTFG